MVPLNDRILLVAAAALAVAVLAVPAAAEESTLDEAQEEPGTVVVREGVRVAEEGQKSSIVRAFHEAWNGEESLEAAGWSQETLDGEPKDPWRHVHRKEDNPNEGPRPTPIRTESKPNAVTIMNEDGTYPTTVDARLVSPTFDLRYVRGTSASASEPYRNDDTRGFLEDLHDAYLENFGSAPTLEPYHYLLVTPPAEWFPVPCRDTVCGPAAEPPTSNERGRSAYEGGSVGASTTVSIDDPFGPGNIFNRPVTVSAPFPGTRDFGLYADEESQIYAPNPVNHREGLTYINLTFWHSWDLEPGNALYLEVRERLSDGSWSDWRHLEPDEAWNQQQTTPSSRYQSEESGDRTLTYNGWDEDERAFVGSSNGLVATTFNLNRFAGTEVQLGWRLSGKAPCQVCTIDSTGWFVDDVVLWTNTYQRDVGVREVVKPDEGDRVAPSEPFHPSATVRNYGHLPMSDVQATFKVTPQDDPDTIVWQDTQTLDRLEPQEQVTVASTEAFDPPETGSYRLVANVTPYQAPDDPGQENLTHRPETAPNDDNDQVVVPFQSQPVPETDVDVTVGNESVQTNLGEAKQFRVDMENTGNLPLAGTVTVTATRLNRTTLEPTDATQVIDRVQVPPGSFPFGRTLNAFGAEDANWSRAFNWKDGLDTAGIYRLNATFQTTEGTFSGEESTYVRATPADYYGEGADELLDVSFDDRSVYSAGMSVQAWEGVFTNEEQEGGNQPYLIAAEPTLPDPVSPSHVWYGRGDDGGYGARTFGNSAERTAGVDRTADLNGTYESTEPDSNDRTRDSNTVDHYWLTRTVNLTEYDDADEILLEFWHFANFQWTGRTSSDQTEPSNARGRVEILPRRNAFLTEPQAGNDTPGASLPDSETGVDPVDNRTRDGDRDLQVVGSDSIYAQTLAKYESTIPWTQETLDLTPWKGQSVTLRFHLETTAQRMKVNSSDAGPLNPWLVDNVELTARDDREEETVFSADLEGDDWRSWSTADGFQMDDPRSPVVIGEGRGWDRYSYGAETFPSGWHITENRKRPEAGSLVTSPMLRWGDPSDRDSLPTGINFSIMRTPEFELGDARNPALSFLTNYSFPADGAWAQTPYNHWTSERTDREHVTSGGSVWIVGEDDAGNVVKRELLTPAQESEARYRAAVGNWYSGDPTCEEGNNDLPGNDEIHCTTPLRHYPDPSEDDTADANVFTGSSGRDLEETGTARWERAVFDLSPYAEPGNASLDYHLEFHAINQRRDDPESFGWLIDQIRVTEGTFANDLAVSEIVRPEEDAVGPGLSKTVALKLENRGLYDQVGVQASYVVRNATGDVVAGPFTKTTNPAQTIPGALTPENPDKNHTVRFGNQPWQTPGKEDKYTIEGRVTLSEGLRGHAFPDDNPNNDILRREVDVSAERSVGLQAAEDRPDDEVISPFVGTTESTRSFEIDVENMGTLPENHAVEGPGNFTLNITIQSPGGEEVFHTSKPLATGTPIQPGQARTQSFESVWSPNRTGVFVISFQLHHSNETVSNAALDNTRNITYTVFEEFLPRPGETLESTFRTDDRGWHFADGSWEFGRGEEARNGANDVLKLDRPLSLRALQNGVVRLNHSYDFERSYDGARLEVKPVGGDTWHPVPPTPVETGYPVNMSTGSPFVEHPGEGAKALSGTSGDGDDPQTVKTSFDVGGVDALTQRSVIFDDDLQRADGDGWGDTSSVRRGDWTRAPVSQVEPHSGDVMFHSNHTLVERSCWRHESENTASSEGSLSCSNSDENSTYAGEYDSRKYLNLTFDDEFPSDRRPLAQRAATSDVQALKVVFWDYRAIGLPELPRADSPEKFNEISLKLTCLGRTCPDDSTVILNPAKSTGYQDNYRDWTRNEYTVPAVALEPLTGQGKELRLSFVHHLTNDDTEATYTWATDSRSLHAGWFIDDVSIQLVDDDGRVSTYWSDDLEGYNRTYEPRTDSPYTPTDEVKAYCEANEPRCATQEVLNIGPWDGGSWTYQKNKEQEDWLDRPLWDPRSEWGEQIWGHVSPGDCWSRSRPSALTFSDGADRRASTIAVDATNDSATVKASAVKFAIRMGAGDGTCEAPEPDEGVALQYKNDDTGWTTIETVSPGDETGWGDGRVEVSNLPAGAKQPDTRFRWIQENVSEPQGDNWAIDDVTIEDSGGDVLYEDDFDEGPLNRTFWTVAGGRVQGDFPCGPLWDGQSETAERIDYPGSYQPNSTQFRACGPTRDHRERAGGSRLVTDLNLRPAVDNVTLSFEHKHRFREEDTQSQQEGIGKQGRSGGRLEVSVDGGRTWIPLEPYLNAGNHKSMYDFGDVTDNAHTTLGGRDGDPEDNSPYGTGGQAFTGISGTVQEDGPDSEWTTYDLSRFAGREVKVAWHAFFDTHNKTMVANEDQGHEFWAIENVSVEAEVFDGERVDMRLRAASDGSTPSKGWTVNDVTMAGVDTRVNVGTEILGIPDDAPVEEGDNRSFGLAVENKGQTPLRAQVNVTVFEVGETTRTVAFTEESTIRLQPQQRVERDSLGGTPLAVNLEESTAYDYVASVDITDESVRDREAIRADNRDVVEVDADAVRSGSILRIEDLRIAPNNVPKDRDEPVTVSADILNDGFNRQATIKNLTVSWTPISGGETELLLTNENRSGGADPRFGAAFQEKTFRWSLSPSQVDSLPKGVYNVTVRVLQDGSDTWREESAEAYVGPGFFQDLAYYQKVADASFDSVEHDECRTPAPATDQIDNHDWRTVENPNNTRRRAFATRAFEGGSGSGGQQEGGGQNPKKASLVCDVENIDALGKHIRVSFYTQWRFNDARNNSHFRVQFGTKDEDQECRGGRTLEPDILETDGAESPDFDQDKWIRKDYKVPTDILQDTAGKKGCLSIIAYAFDERVQDVVVDDLLVSPYQVGMTPDRAVASVQDNTRKRFPFEVQNAGTYNDSYEFDFVDSNGEPGNVPRSWELSVETPDGSPVDTVSLAAGESRILHMVLDIPVQQLGSISGTTEVPLSAISTTQELIRATSTFKFNFDYPPRPNVKILGAEVNNPDFAAGRPRTVTVTVANVGEEPAQELPLAITDTMPPRFGQAPKELTQLGGEPLPSPTLQPGDVTTLTAGWTPEQAGPHNLTVELDPPNDIAESNEEDNVEVLEVPVGSARFPDLETHIEVSESEPLAGDTIDVNATITNTGRAPAQGVRVNLRVGVSDLLDGEPPHILGTVIEPGETVELDATWPASFPGDYQAFLKAFPLSGTLEPADTQDDNLAVQSVEVRTQAVSLEGPEQPVEVSQGEEITAPITLANRGERNETVDLRSSAAGDLRSRLTLDGVSVTTADVARDEARNLTLQIRAPSQAEAGTYDVQVTAVSQKTGQTETTTVRVAIAEEPGLSLAASALDVDPGGGSLPLEVTNTGNAPATVNVSALDLPAGWSLDAPPTTLEPFESARLEPRLDVPTAARSGVRNFTAQVSSGDAEASAPVRVEVGSRAVVDASLEPGSVDLRPGASVTFQATLDSVGNMPAFVDLSMDAPDAWDVETPRPQARIAEGDTVAFNVTVDVPQEADPGARELRIVAEGREETFTDNATVDVGIPDLTITNVEQNPRVNVEAGDEVSFRLTVRNPGTLTVEETGVGFYVDDGLQGFGDLTDITPGGKAEITLNWTAEAGEHVVLTVADPGESITEDDEGNNARLLVVQVGGDAQVFGDVQRAVPAPAGLGLVALLAAALGRRWRT